LDGQYESGQEEKISMKIREVITERIEISWIRPWIKSAVAAVDRYDDDIEWYERFFHNLNQSPELRAWREENIKNPLKLRPRIMALPGNKTPLINAEHSMEGGEHQISIEVNSAYAPKDEKSQNAFVNKLAAMMVHELNHAHQREQQLQQTGSVSAALDIDTTVWKKSPPEPRNEREEYYQYMIDHMEQDAWLSQIASEIEGKLGGDSLAQLNKIFTDVKKDPYVVIGKSILDLTALKMLYDGFQHYHKYLKRSVEDNWNRVKKSLYSYLQQLNK
jgi:hypothetical protein